MRSVCAIVVLVVALGCVICKAQMYAPAPIPVPEEPMSDETDAWIALFDETKLEQDLQAFDDYWSGKAERERRIAIVLDRMRRRDQEFDNLMAQTVKQMQWWFRFMAQQEEVTAVQHGIVEMSQCLMDAINSWQDKDAGKNMRNKLSRLIQEDKVFHETFLNVTKEMERPIV